MTQTQSYSGVRQMAFMLSKQEQERLIREMIFNIGYSVPDFEEVEPTSDRLKSRLRTAYAEARNGDVMAQEEAHQMRDEFVKAAV